MHSLAVPAYSVLATTLDCRHHHVSAPSDAKSTHGACAAAQVDVSRLRTQLFSSSRGYAQLLACSAASTMLPCQPSDDASDIRRSGPVPPPMPSPCGTADSVDMQRPGMHDVWDSPVQQAGALHTQLPQPTQASPASVLPGCLLQLARQGPEAAKAAVEQLDVQGAAQAIISLAHHSFHNPVTSETDLQVYACLARALALWLQAAGFFPAGTVQHIVPTLCWACGVLVAHLTRDSMSQLPSKPRRRQWHTQQQHHTLQPLDPAVATTPAQQACVALRQCAVWAAQQLEPLLAVTGSVQSQTTHHMSDQHSHNTSFLQSTQPHRRNSTQTRDPVAASQMVSATCLAHVLRHLAVLQLRPSSRWCYSYCAACLALLRQRSSQSSRQFTSHEVSMTLWALAKLQIRPPQALTAALQTRLGQQISTATQQCLANSLWASARLGAAPSYQLLTAWWVFMGRLVSKRYGSCTPMAGSLEDRSRCTGRDQAHNWPTAGMSLLHTDVDAVKTGCRCGRFTETVHGSHQTDHPDSSVAFIQQQAAQSQHHVSQSLWAMATMKTKPCHKWLADLLTRTTDSLLYASSQSLANTMWALGELGHTPTAAWTATFLAACEPHLSTMPPQHVCNLLHGLHQAEVVVPQHWGHQVVAACTAAVRQRQYSAAQLCSLVWSLSQLRVDADQGLLQAALSASSRHMHWYAGAEGRHSAVAGAGQQHEQAARPSAVVKLGNSLQWPRRRVAGSLAGVHSSLLSQAGSRIQQAAVAVRLHRAQPRLRAVVARAGAQEQQGQPSLQQLSSRRSGLPGRLRMKLLCSLARRRQRQRQQLHAVRTTGKLSQLSPLTLARLLHGLAAGMAAVDTPVLPKPAWRAACVYALRVSLRRMDARTLALALPAARSLGVNLPLQPTRRALHRVVRDAAAHDASHVAALVSTLAKDPRIAKADWLVLCMLRLTQLVSSLSAEAVAQVARTLPALLSRQPASSTGSTGGSHRAQLAAHWHTGVRGLAQALAQRAATCMTSMPAADIHAVAVGLAAVPEAPLSGPSEASATTEALHPLLQLLQFLEARLHQLSPVHLADILPSIAPHVAPGSAPTSFCAAAEAAVVRCLPHTSLAGGQKVHLLHGLLQLSRTVAPDTATLWYQCTATQLTRLNPQDLSLALRLVDEMVRAQHLPQPDAAWLRSATEAVGVVSTAADWAVKKQLPADHEHTHLSDQEQVLVGSTAGHLVAVAVRLHGLSSTQSLPARSKQLITSHLQRVLSAASVDLQFSGMLLHAAHELRGVNPAACPAWVRGHAEALLQGVLTMSPQDLVRQIWDHAASSVGGEAMAAAPELASGSSFVSMPPKAAAAAAHRVVELFMMLARWGVAPSAAWVQGAVEQVAARIGCFTGPQAAAFLRTLALLGCAPGSLQTSALDPLLFGSLQRMRVQCSSAQLSEVVWALSVLQVQPSAEWWSAYESELQSRMGHMTGEELCEVMWSLGALRRRPPHAWMDAFARAILRQLHTCGPDALARLVWSLAAVEEVAGKAFAERYLTVSQQILQVPGSFSAQSLTLMLGGLVALNITPRAQWLTLYTAELRAALPTCRAVHLSKALHSLATLGHTLDAATLAQVTDAACARVAEMDTGAAAQASFGLARLDTTQGQRYLRRLVDALAEVHGTPAPARGARRGVGMQGGAGPAAAGLQSHAPAQGTGDAQQYSQSDTDSEEGADSEGCTDTDDSSPAAARSGAARRRATRTRQQGRLGGSRSRRPGSSPGRSVARLR